MSTNEAPIGPGPFMSPDYTSGDLNLTDPEPDVSGWPNPVVDERRLNALALALQYVREQDAGSTSTGDILAIADQFDRWLIRA